MRQRRLWIAYLLMGTIAASLLAGGGNQGADFQPAEEAVQEDTGREAAEPMEAAQAEAAQADSDGSGILIAYFAVAENSDVDAASSASMVTVNGEAEGRVQHLANLIQKETGGELFSIQTSVDYPGDGGKLIDYATEEQDDDARPELISHIEDLDQYNVVFVVSQIGGEPALWQYLHFWSIMICQERESFHSVRMKAAVWVAVNGI